MPFVSCKVELGTLVPDKTYDLTLPLVDSGCGSIHLLLCLSGMAVNEMDECDGPQNDVTEESYVSGGVSIHVQSHIACEVLLCPELCIACVVTMSDSHNLNLQRIRCTLEFYYHTSTRMHGLCVCVCACACVCVCMCVYVCVCVCVCAWRSKHAPINPHA